MFLITIKEAKLHRMCNTINVGQYSPIWGPPDVLEFSNSFVSGRNVLHQLLSESFKIGNAND